MIQKYRYLAAIVVCLGFYANASAFSARVIKAPGLEHVTLEFVVDSHGALQFEVFDYKLMVRTEYIRPDMIDHSIRNMNYHQLQLFLGGQWGDVGCLHLDRINGEFRLRVLNYPFSKN